MAGEIHQQEPIDFDVIVVGGGHAGIEAALACARLGVLTALVTHDPLEIGRMPCNPAVGGLGKGQLVREIDALGGEMALAIDATGIQFRILNRRKGPAVQSPRAQADKRDYARYMQRVVASQPGLTVIPGEVTRLIVETLGSGGARRRIAGVATSSGKELGAKCVVLAGGTFLRGLMHVGGTRRAGGREGAASSDLLSEDLRRHGFELRRLKTGTPMRLRRSSIDLAALPEQAGDSDPHPFSFRTRDFAPDQVVCHMAWTNERTHGLIRANLHRSPLYAGIIEGLGPRYCPSIEDKVVRFAEKPRHQIFLEPEGRDSDEIYVSGCSTSLPADVQVDLVRSIEGLEDAELVRFGYAVEYDSLPSYQIRPTLESKNIDGLYMAGQILGTSGYEEAAAQGLVAGVNAALRITNKQPLILRRDEAYIGVLIDDLITKQIEEPYRIFTSRAEHRLSLRCDNAESRLIRHAQRLGLLSPGDLQEMRDHANNVRQNIQIINNKSINTIAAFGGDQERRAGRISEEVEAELKYAGYIARQNRLLGRQQRLEDFELPEDLPYMEWTSLSSEAREKLDRTRPVTLGQAGRIDGVRQADLAILAVLVHRSLARRKGQ